MALVADLESQKLLQRANRHLQFNPGGDPHPSNAGPGLAASGGLGPLVRTQFLMDYRDLVRLAGIAVTLGYRAEVHTLTKLPDPAPTEPSAA